MAIKSKLPNTGTTIFTTMSALAREHQAINLGQGFPDFDCDTVLLDIVERHLRDSKNQYAPMAGAPALREAIAAKIYRTHELSIDPLKDICVTSGATQGLYSTIQALVHPGDEVIIIEPAYDLYAPSIRLNGGIVVPYPLSAPDYRVDWQALEDLVTERTTMIIINTPHNPTGQILHADDLTQLQRISCKHDLYVLSDEAYEHIIFDGEQHESVLRYPELWERSIAVFSFGKTFHVTGWKIGYVIAHESIMTEIKKVHQWTTFSINHFLQCAIAEYLEDASHYEHLGRFFSDKRDLLTRELASSRLKPIHSAGTYFQLYDYRDISDSSDLDFAVELTRDHGVAAIPLSPFYTHPRPEDRVIRLCFGKTDQALLNAAERLRHL